MVVGFEGKGLNQYDVCRIVVSQHDVLVTTPCPDRELSKVSCEECCQRYDPEDDLVDGCRHCVH